MNSDDTFLLVMGAAISAARRRLAMTGANRIEENTVKKKLCTLHLWDRHQKKIK